MDAGGRSPRQSGQPQPFNVRRYGMQIAVLQQLLDEAFHGGFCRHCTHLVDDHRALGWPKLPPVVCDRAECVCVLDQQEKIHAAGVGLRGDADVAG